MVIRHPSLLSFSLFSSFFSYPNGREKQPPLSLARSSLYHRPDSILLSFSLAFSFSPSSIHLSIFLFLSLPYPRAPLSLYFPLSLFSCLLLSPCSASSFSAERLLRFSSVIDVASSPLPGLFPFAATILETTANQLFLRENASGNDRRCSPPPSLSPRYFSSRYHRAFPGWKDWNLPEEFPPFSSFAVPSLPTSFSFSLSPLSLSLLASFLTSSRCG